jgi:hypothetical protein
MSSDVMVPSGAVQAGEHVELAMLREALIVEQARSSRLDGELGYALLTIGRLRGRLREAGINPDGLFGADLRSEGPEPAETSVTDAHGRPAARGQPD